MAGCEPTPQSAAQVQEEFSRLYGQLAVDTLRQITHRKLEGYANAELATQLQLSLRAVERKVPIHGYLAEDPVEPQIDEQGTADVRNEP